MPEKAPVVERGVVSMSGAAWEEARQRAAVIEPLAARRSISNAAADAAGEQLGLSRRQVYKLVNRWRKGSGLVTDLAVRHSDGGKGRGRLPEEVESVIGNVLRTFYLKRQRPRFAAVYRDVARGCRVRSVAVRRSGAAARAR
jgi:putative transposase